MRLWGLIKNMSLAQLWQLMLLCAGNLSKIRPTWGATKMSISLASKYYGSAHHKNTPANAFRHAVWNYLVAKRCFRSDQNIEKVIDWTREITDFHEDLFPNEELARAMDLHNNKVGRTVFRKHVEQEEKDMIQLILERTEQSILVSSMEELLNLNEEQLVHIEIKNS